MAKKIAFIPWDRKTGHGFLQIYRNASQWKDNQKQGKELEICCYGDGNKILSGGFKTIYVLGHGNKDLDFIAPELTRKSPHALNAVTVAYRLYDSGLPTTFDGKVKAYSCWSSVGDSHGHGQFAKQLANAMFTNGYLSCSYYGYGAPLEKWMRAGHKHALKGFFSWFVCCFPWGAPTAKSVRDEITNPEDVKRYRNWGIEEPADLQMTRTAAYQP